MQNNNLEIFGGKVLSNTCKFICFSLLLFFFANEGCSQDFFEEKLVLPQPAQKYIKSMNFTKTPTKEVLFSLANEIGISVLVEDKIFGEVTVAFNNILSEEALTIVMNISKLGFCWENNVLRIFPKEAEPIITKALSVKSNAHRFLPILERIVTYGRGNVQVDSRTNSIYISDTEAKIQEIKYLLPQLEIQFQEEDKNAKLGPNFIRFNEPIDDLESGQAVRFTLEILKTDNASSSYIVNFFKEAKKCRLDIATFGISTNSLKSVLPKLSFDFYCFYEGLFPGHKVEAIKLGN